MTMPPRARKQPHSYTRHGVTITDDYAWLRADNWQQVMREPESLSADIRDYLEAENAYLKEKLAKTEPLQETLFEEMKARIKEDDSSVPSPDGPWAYYSSYVTGGQYPRFCRCPREEADTVPDQRSGEVILLDGNTESEGFEYWQLGGLSHSPDHNLIAYAVDTAGSEYYTLRFRDLATGKDLPDVIENTGGMVWAKDSRTIYYIRLDDNHRPLYVHRHTLGTPASDDALVYQEADTAFYVHLSETQSGDYLMIDISDHETSEVHLLDAGDPNARPRLIEARTTGLEYEVDHNGDHLYILTNANNAVDFAICTAPVADPGRANWSPLIPHTPGTLIITHALLKAHMIRLERTNSLPQIVVRDLASGAEHSVAFDEEAYSLGLGVGYEFDTTTVRFTYASMTTPSQTFDYDLVSRARTLRKTQEVPSGHEPADYVTRRLYATAGDGAEVPISLLYHRDTPLDGTAPLLLYGYGSYGIAMPASFSTTRLSLVNRGFVYAITHIRGGKDKGYGWYTDGKRGTKLNTFTDFITCGEYLAEQKFTSAGRIVGHGGSAGGMLMGAVANRAPDLFLGIMANVPFVDVLNTILDDTLPLTPPEWAEWGNPILSAEDFALIRSYSPYDNVEAKDYPHILALGGLTDPRVTYWEPAKWIARLRELNTSDKMILFKTNMGAGHGGASGRFDSLKETALEYAFALKIAGKAD